MNSPRKPDAQAILEHLSRLKREYANDSERARWPDFLFHFTALGNAVSILEGGTIYSRAELDRRGLSISDAASPDVLQVTDARVKENVRLYFRPRTPTQFRNEGIRAKTTIKLGAHCPVPVVLLFDAREILTRVTTQFSDGNLAANGTTVGSDAAFFQGMPFDKIYHTGVHNDHEITRCRNAEVIVPRELELTALRGVRCRSQAELETLKNLLSYDAFMQWHDKLGVDNRRNLYYARWLFVRQATLLAGELHMQMENANPAERFNARLEVESLSSDKNGIWEKQDYAVGASLSFNLPGYDDNYRVRFFLDDHLVYCGEYHSEDGQTWD